MKPFIAFFVTVVGLTVFAAYNETVQVAQVVTVPQELTTPLVQHTNDPTECKKVCAPAGYDGAMPKEFPDAVVTTTCEGDYCAKAGHHEENPPGDDEESCKAHWSCAVHCSEVCCICLRECI